MLNEESTTDRRHLCHMEQRADCIQLMVSWPDDHLFDLLCLGVFLLYHLRKVLDDVGECWLGQNVLPEV